MSLHLWARCLPVPHAPSCLWTFTDPDDKTVNREAARHSGDPRLKGALRPGHSVLVESTRTDGAR